jgi:hypothetical protein
MPMRPLLVLVAALVAACAAHPAAAAGPATVDTTVAGVLVNGKASVLGPLAALASTGQVDPTGNPLSPAEGNAQRIAPTALRLTARHLHAETDVVRLEPVPAAAVLPDHHTETADFPDAVAHTTPARQKFQVYLAPVPGRPLPVARLDAVQAQLQPTAAAVAEPHRRVATDRPELRPAPGPALAVGGGLQALHVEGDLLLTLWEWDLDVSSDNAMLRSGASYTDYAPPVGPFGTAGRSEERQLFVLAEGATLDLMFPFDAAVAVTLQPTSASLDGRLVLQGPDGYLVTPTGNRPLSDGDWIDGDFGATLTQLTSSSFHATLAGTGTARLAGLTVAVAGPASSPTGAIVAAVAASSIVVLGTWRLWGRRSAPAALQVPRAPLDPAADNERQALRWLEAAAEGSVLWDSDLMRAFDWSAERAQSVLRSLQAKGQVRCKDVALAPGRSSLGHIRLTAAGMDRLRAGPGDDAEAPRTGLRRLVSR